MNSRGEASDHDLAIEMPGGVTEHRHHHIEPDQHRQAAEHEQARHHQAPIHHHAWIGLDGNDRGADRGRHIDMPVDDQWEGDTEIEKARIAQSSPIALPMTIMIQPLKVVKTACRKSVVETSAGRSRIVR